MSDRQRENKGRILQSTEIGGFVLLNNEKLGRVLDLIEGIVEPRDGAEEIALAKAKALKNEEQAILSLYDRLGGGVKYEGRKVATGTFYDFDLKEPRTKAKLDESDFSDEFVLVKKSTKKAVDKETTSERVKRVAKKASKAEVPTEEETPKKSKKTSK